jgi:TolB protein
MRSRTLAPSCHLNVGRASARRLRDASTQIDRRASKRGRIAAAGLKPGLRLVALLLFALPLFAQTDITTTISPTQGMPVIRIAIPQPIMTPSTDEKGVTLTTFEVVHEPFFNPLTRDIAASGVYAIAPLPPNVPATPERAKQAGAELLLLTNIFQIGDEFVIEARLLDTAGKINYGKRYRGTAGALSRMAHMIANDLIQTVNGRPGIFLSQIAFASNRTGTYEIWLMDWDGANQRQITRHNALSILPSWSADNERMVYTSFAGGTSNMYIISRHGGARTKVTSGLNLNTSATFSPVSNDIAFVGSVKGNPDIYLIKDDSTNIRRLTSSDTIESTPEWNPSGRQISFTSGRSGSPQIYVMDAEGTNVRRISFEGDWNDDATWSPDGTQLAYTSRVQGRFQIRIMDLATQQSRIVAGEASNEQPAFSPDGRWLSFQSNRSGKWQIYKMRVDGSDLLQLTFDGENKDPDWSKKRE